MGSESKFQLTQQINTEDSTPGTEFIVQVLYRAIIPILQTENGRSERLRDFVRVTERVSDGKNLNQGLPDVKDTTLICSTVLLLAELGPCWVPTLRAPYCGTRSHV